MNSIIRIVALVAGLVLMLNITPSWGQPTCASPGCNPTVSDSGGNTAGGSSALSSNIFGFGAANTAFGLTALQSNTTGTGNTASGFTALQSNSTGDGNTATGSSALSSNTTGGFNTANGRAALGSNTTGSGNTASGDQALQNNTTGDNNAASGIFALQSNTTGSGNIANGFEALLFNTTGVNNTALGTQALQASTGNKNIAIGYKAGAMLTSGHNNIYIGNLGASSEFQTIRVGTAQTSTFFAGIAGANVNGATVEIDATTGQLGVKMSSARYKQDITPMGTSSDGLLHLRPVTFSYKEDAQKVKHYGLVAEEVGAVYPELVTRTATGEVQTVKYQELLPMLLNELQRQRQEFQQALQSQQRELAELRALMGQRREMAASAR